MDSLSDTQERYKEKIRLKLEEVRGSLLIDAPCGWAMHAEKDACGRCIMHETTGMQRWVESSKQSHW